MRRFVKNDTITTIYFCSFLWSWSLIESKQIWVCDLKGNWIFRGINNWSNGPLLKSRWSKNSHQYWLILLEVGLWFNNNTIIFSWALELRYRLLPYFYTLDREWYNKSRPLVRPMFYQQEAIETVDIWNQFYLGPNIIVAPVLKPDSEFVNIHLPTGI